MKSTKLRLTLALLMVCMIVTCFAGCSKKTPQEAIAGTYDLYMITKQGQGDPVMRSDIPPYMMDDILETVQINEDGTCILTNGDGSIQKFTVKFASYNETSGDYVFTLQEQVDDSDRIFYGADEIEGKLSGDDLYFLKYEYGYDYVYR